MLWEDIKLKRLLRIVVATLAGITLVSMCVVVVSAYDSRPTLNAEQKQEWEKQKRWLYEMGYDNEDISYSEQLYYEIASQTDKSIAEYTLGLLLSQINEQYGQEAYDSCFQKDGTLNETKLANYQRQMQAERIKAMNQEVINSILSLYSASTVASP